MDGEVTHHGVIGSSFNGEIRDDSSELSIQVGSFADLVETTELHATTEKFRLKAGDVSNVSASLLLDDYTNTLLNPTEVDWSFNSSLLYFENDSFVARSSERREFVDIYAHAQGLSTSFRLYILPSESVVSEDSFLPQILHSSIKLDSDGWRFSDWFGTFYDAKNGWVYHTGHGWLNLGNAGDSGSMWMWSSKQEWLWTGEGIYPHLFRNRDLTWLYFFREVVPAKVFYNYNTQKIEKE